MKSYKINDGDIFYETPWKRDEVRQKHKHKLTCDKNRAKRKKKKK